MYARLYSWYYVPVTVHKILLHGPDVMKHFLLLIGQFSGEAGKARHKDYRNIPEFNSWKFSRVASH